MRRNNHLPRTHENPHMHHIIRTISILSPENHISRLRLRPWQMLAHGRMILCLCRAGDFPVPGFAGGVLGEAGAVEAAVGGAVASAAAVDVGDSDFGDGGGDEGGAGSTGGRGLAGGAALFSFMSTPVLISGCGRRHGSLPG